MTTTERLLWLVLLVLAVYRLSYLTTTDAGPGYVFRRFRAWVHRRYGDSWQYTGASCLFCQSVWYALPAALVYEYGLHIPLVRVVAVWLALAGAVLAGHWLVLTWIQRVESG